MRKSISRIFDGEGALLVINDLGAQPAIWRLEWCRVVTGFSCDYQRGYQRVPVGATSGGDRVSWFTTSLCAHFAAPELCSGRAHQASSVMAVSAR
ncbi:MAG: hypothetical protein JWN61_600 [Pseudonocardiales bacterium]|nr:hypothetical protein [Pseudonocardiales bacterium]